MDNTLAHGRLPDPRRYYDRSIFEQETSIIESKLWIFAGLVSDLPKRNDYLTIKVGTRSVILQNFDAGLRAFDNVCGHRSCRLRSEPKGSGPIRCPYHSWIFGADGIPVVIPLNEEVFQIPDERRADYRLRTWQVETCGQLVFVRRTPTGPSLKETLGPLYPKFETLTAALGEEVTRDCWDYAANWKVCVENTLDEYHASFVHPTTFRPLLGKNFEYAYFGDHSSVRVEIQHDQLEKWNKINRMIASRPVATDTYEHFVAFPLLTLATTYGATFSLQTFDLIGPELTRLTSRLFVSKGIGAGAKRALGEAARAFNTQVFEEDKFVCEQMQLGLRESSGGGIAGRLEQRLVHFQQTAQRVFQYHGQQPRC